MTEKIIAIIIGWFIYYITKNIEVVVLFYSSYGLGILIDLKNKKS